MLRVMVCGFFLVFFLFASENNLAAGWENIYCCDYRGENVPELWNGLKMSCFSTVKSPVAGPVVEIECQYNREELLWPSFFVISRPASELKSIDAVRISFYVRGKEGNIMGMRITEDAPGATRFSDTEEHKMTGKWQKICYIKKLKPIHCDYINIPRIFFLKSNAGDKFYFSPLIIDGQKRDK